MPNLATNSYRMHRAFFFLVATTALSAWNAALHAQTPDWMFALEGAYIGRYEVPDPSGLKDELTSDARLDGRRNLSENGFVLQWMIEGESGVVETLSTWHWKEGQMCETEIVGGRPAEVCWLLHRQTDHAVVLRRGGDWEGQAMLFERTVERLPGQLRITDQHNNGDGTWRFHHGFVFEEMKPEASKR